MRLPEGDGDYLLLVDHGAYEGWAVVGRYLSATAALSAARKGNLYGPWLIVQIVSFAVAEG